MIGETMVNLQSGGYRRLSILVSFFLLLIVNGAAYEAINVIPVAALVGVMWVVCYHTFDWGSLRIMWMSVQPASWRDRFGDHKYHKINRSDALVIAVVTVVTVLTDLFLAVVCGVVITAIVYAWHSGEVLRVVRVENVDVGGTHRRVYELDGPLFFGSAMRFMTFFAPREDPGDVEIHCQVTGSGERGRRGGGKDPLPGCCGSNRVGWKGTLIKGALARSDALPRTGRGR